MGWLTPKFVYVFATRRDNPEAVWGIFTLDPMASKLAEMWAKRMAKRFDQRLFVSWHLCLEEDAAEAKMQELADKGYAFAEVDTDTGSFKSPAAIELNMMAPHG